MLTLGLVGEEGVDLGGRSVVRDDGEALVVHVQNQVLALENSKHRRSRWIADLKTYHDGETNETDISAAGGSVDAI